MLFCLISASIIHFVSPTIFPFASSPCTFPLTPWHLLFLSTFAFFICRLSFLDGCTSLFFWVSLSPATLRFPGMNAWLRHSSFFVFTRLSLSSSCSCSVVSFRTSHYAECVPLQTLISRHYHPGPSQGAFSVSISVWVLVCYLLHLMSCLRPKLQSIYFRHSMLVCVVPYWRNAVAAHLPELSIRVSPHSRSVLLVPLMSKKWPIIN